MQIEERIEYTVDIELKYVDGSDEDMDGFGYLNVYIDGRFLFNIYMPAVIAQNPKMVSAFKHAILGGYKEGHFRGSNEVQEKLRRVAKLVKDLL